MAHPHATFAETPAHEKPAAVLAAHSVWAACEFVYLPVGHAVQPPPTPLLSLPVPEYILTGHVHVVLPLATVEVDPEPVHEEHDREFVPDENVLLPQGLHVASVPESARILPAGQVQANVEPVPKIAKAVEDPGAKLVLHVHVLVPADDVDPSGQAVQVTVPPLPEL